VGVPGAVVAGGVGAVGADAISAGDGLNAITDPGVWYTVTSLGVVAEGAARSNLVDGLVRGEQEDEGQHGDVVQKRLG
jgi:hypothetical protein